MMLCPKLVMYVGQIAFSLQFVEYVGLPLETPGATHVLGSQLYGYSSVLKASAPATLMTACWTLPGVVISWLRLVTAVARPLSGSLLPLRLFRERPPPPMMHLSPRPPETPLSPEP